MDALIERLEARASEDEKCALNNEIVATCLAPELGKFNSRSGDGWNTYAVRMAVDHQNSARRDRQYASDLREAIATLRALHPLPARPERDE